MSMGDAGEYDDPVACRNVDPITADAIRDLEAEDVSIFVPSGNDGHDQGVSFPACVPEAIAVGGVYDANLGPISWCGDATCTQTLCTDSPTGPDVFVCHSNSGSLLDLLAPNFQTRTTDIGGVTDFFGGTSAASPYAAAQGALLYEADPATTPAAVRALLTGHGPLVTNPDSGLSFPRSDAAGALTELVGGADVDGDGVPEDGDGSGVPGDGPCASGETHLCDDNCPADPNAGQADADGDGIGDVCDSACSNGLDDDGDGAADFPDDPGCADASDAAETSPSLACDDGVDNDTDGRIDFDPVTFADPGDETTLPSGSGDPGCKDPSWSTESPQCQDGIHNDDDGMMDYDGGYSANGSADPTGPDPHCVDKPWRDREAAYPRRSYPCGLGAELALLLPPLMWLWWRHRDTTGKIEQ
jgi:hypothetical protein